MNELTFSKRAAGGYNVHQGDKIIGVVQRKEQWTVRGTWVYWIAYRSNVYIGRDQATRKEAASQLIALTS